MVEMVYKPTTTIALKFINLLHDLVVSYVKLCLRVWMDLTTSQQNVTAGSVLTPGPAKLHKFMFSDRYHLTASTLAWVCAPMTGLMPWITFFDRWRTSILLLPLNVFLKARPVYFKVDSTISGAFQCSACSTAAPTPCTSSTINFLGVEGPFLNEVGQSRVIW